MDNQLGTPETAGSGDHRKPEVSVWNRSEHLQLQASNLILCMTNTGLALT